MSILRASIFIAIGGEIPFLFSLTSLLYCVKEYARHSR